MLSPSDPSKKRGSSRSGGKGSSERVNSSTGKPKNIKRRKFFPKGDKHSSDKLGKEDAIIEDENENLNSILQQHDESKEKLDHKYQKMDSKRRNSSNFSGRMSPSAEIKDSIPK
jgi:hypothetical protein